MSDPSAPLARGLDRQEGCIRYHESLRDDLAILFRISYLNGISRRPLTLAI